MPAKKLFQFSEQSGCPHWFHQRSIRVVNRIRWEVVLTKAGNDDDRNVGTAHLEMTGELMSVHFGHVYIRYQNMDLAGIFRRLV